ncbi:MAG: AAA family ATPase [Blautia sp.]|nr:AAA family ATPase [Blautia sp.]
MALKIAVGGEDFVKLRRGKGYYVDKTELLFDLVETNNTVTLFTRPRRFGKTLTMRMMESFFSIFMKDYADVFEGLAILNHSEFCAEYRNRYPTVFLTLKDVEGRSFELAYDKLKTTIADVCKKLSFLAEDERTDEDDRMRFKRLKSETGTESDVQNSLKTITRMMNAAYQKPVILLIDEYDVPLAKAYVNGFYPQMLDVTRGLMSTSLKTNDYLKFAVVTGCLRIPKESIFTGVNNFASYSVLDEDFSDGFGFTQDEAAQMLASFNRSEKMETIKEWYDGYIFGNSKVFCPWDVVNYVAALMKRENAKPRNYWENTSGNDAIKAFFGLENVDVSDKFETLLNGGTIQETVTNALTYDQAYQSERNLWSILLMTGYVTPIQREDYVGDEGQCEVELRIPNREIASIFQTAVADHFTESVDESKQRELMRALWDGDEKKASEILSDFLWQTISYLDYHEDYYHAFVAGVFKGRGGYVVSSNKGRGLGRPDLDLRDKHNRRAMIIEMKKAESEERMEYWCEEALLQIAKGQYADAMAGYKQVLCYGIAFFRKSALVKKQPSYRTGLSAH